MLSTVLNVWIFLAVVLILLVNIQNVAFLFWILVWFVSQVFNLLSYVGASCSSITSVSTILISAVLLLIVAKIMKSFFHSS